MRPSIPITPLLLLISNANAFHVSVASTSTVIGSKCQSSSCHKHFIHNSPVNVPLTSYTILSSKNDDQDSTTIELLNDTTASRDNAVDNVTDATATTTVT
mmetsp:Transcript_17193/g.22589  ORF Transcript_17193/g.22589 Transcript_17193/m.22589 type:complete len:100 (-) Transcript_17193:19-318(-)